MIKLFIAIASLFMMLSASQKSYSIKQADDAFKSLDCEFEYCKKEEPKPKVIVKERVVYKEKPVVVEKIKVVEKPVVVEKIVYKERPKKKEQPQLKIVTNPPVKKGENTALQSKVVYNKAYFDMFPKSQAPILDYITFDKRKSFDVGQFVDSVTRIKESNLKVAIYGRLDVPKSITTKQVYISSGEIYQYDYWNWGKKNIYYNNNTKHRQNSDVFLAEVQEDGTGSRFVDYKIVINFNKPWEVKTSEKSLSPSTYFFKMAPRVRGYKNKFIPVKVYIIEE